jgi:hypothetical protein
MLTPPKIERDPNIIKLEQDVFAQLNKIIEPKVKQQKPVTPNGLEFVSFEDAIKELVNLNK